MDTALYAYALKQIFMPLRQCGFVLRLFTAAQATISDTYTMHFIIIFGTIDTQVVVMAMHLALPALHFMATLSDGLFFSRPT